MVDFAITLFNKHQLTNYWVFQPLKAIKGQIQFWTDIQSTEITQPLKKFGLWVSLQNWIGSLMAFKGWNTLICDKHCLFNDVMAKSALSWFFVNNTYYRVLYYNFMWVFYIFFKLWLGSSIWIFGVGSYNRDGPCNRACTVTYKFLLKIYKKNLLLSILIRTVMTKPNKIAPNWRSPETLILDFSRCITSNMTTNNRAPVAMPEK